MSPSLHSAVMSSPFPSPSPPPFPLERKLKKPLMEKRRRARMNECLDQLKQLLLHVAPHQRSKLEKADILEMTVAFLKQHQEFKNFQTSESGSGQRQAFVDGFSIASMASLEFLQNTLADSGMARVALTQHLHTILNAQMATFNDDCALSPSSVQFCVTVSPGSCSSPQSPYASPPTSTSMAPYRFTGPPYPVNQKRTQQFLKPPVPRTQTTPVSSPYHPPPAPPSSCPTTLTFKLPKRSVSPLQNFESKVWRPF